MSARAASTQYYSDDSQSDSVYQQTRGQRIDQTGKIANFFRSCRLYWTPASESPTQNPSIEGSGFCVSRLGLTNIRLITEQSACRLSPDRSPTCQNWQKGSRSTDSQRGKVAHSHRRASDSLQINAALTATVCRNPVPLHPTKAIGINATTQPSTTAISPILRSAQSSDQPAIPTA